MNTTTIEIVLHFPQEVDQLGAYNDVARLRGVRAARFKRRNKHIVATLSVEKWKESEIRQQATQLRNVTVEV